MKELTIEEKAKRYDEAINAIKELKENHPTALVIKDWIKENFPELAESEDEKIRKWLLNFVQGLPDEGLDFHFYNLNKEQVVAWLEKQGEQKPKQEWSEEDEQYLLVCKNALAKYQTTDKWDAHIIFHWLENKLKSIRPQNTWKPSDEQIRTLELAIDYWKPNDVSVTTPLYNLLEQLKKLREE